MSYDSEENLLLKLVPLINDDCSKLIETIEETKELQTEKNKNQEQIAKNRIVIEDLNNKLLEEKIELSQAKEKLFYYTKINNPTIEEPNNKFPLKKERKKYKNLAETSSYDAIRQYFNKKIIKLSPQNLDDSPSDSIKDYIYGSKKKTFKHKKLYQLLVLNALYSLFKYAPNKGEELEKYINDRNKKLDNWFGQDNASLIKLKNKIKEVLKEEPEAHQPIISKNEENIEFVILKIICSTPLVYYEQIRVSAFKWILNKLKKIQEDIDKIKKENLSGFFSITGNKYFSQYQELKFLLKRSVELKSNYIIHPEFFKSIEILINLLKLKRNYKELKKKKECFDEKIIEEIETLYKNTSYIPGKLILYTYYQDIYALRLLPKEFEDTKIKPADKSLKAFLYDLNKDIDKYNKRRKETEVSPANLFGKSPIIETENKFDEEEKSFNDNFKKIKAIPRHSLKTSKKFIYHLVSLVQELEYEHETKALKLEENINLLIGLDKEGGAIDKDKYDEFKNNTENGNFYHYLRLLRLENTEAIEKFWQYIKEKESDKSTKLIDIDKIQKIPITYKDDPKYIAIKGLQHIEDNDTNLNEIALNNYFFLKTELHNLDNKIEKPDNKQEENKGLETFVRDKILKHCSNILSTKGSLNVEQAFLTVNFNEYEGPTYKDLYTFSLNDNSVIAKNENAFNNTLTYMMIKGIKAEEVSDKNYQLSNLEILKDDTDKPKLRENMLANDIVKETTDFKKLKNGRSILLIRISDFKNVFKNGNSEEEEETLITQAVLTFYLSADKRVDETNLRLLLLLRRSLSNYLKNQTNDNTFLELVRYSERDNYLSNLRHELVDYYFNQERMFKLVLKNEQILKKFIISINKSIPDIMDSNSLKEEFKITTNALKGQTIGFDEKSLEISTSKSDRALEQLIKVIFDSTFLGRGKVFEKSYRLELQPFNILFPDVIFNVIIPQIIINIKQYYPLDDENVITISSLYESNVLRLIFKNTIEFYRLNVKRNKNKSARGIKMCKEIIENYNKINVNKITLIILPDREVIKTDKEFSVTIEVKIK